MPTPPPDTPLTPSDLAAYGLKESDLAAVAVLECSQTLLSMTVKQRPTITDYCCHCNAALPGRQRRYVAAYCIDCKRRIKAARAKAYARKIRNQL